MINIATSGATQIISKHGFAEVIENTITKQKSLHALVPIKKGEVISTFAAGNEYSRFAVGPDGEIYTIFKAGLFGANSQALARMPELAALIRRLGRAERAARPQALPPQPLDATVHRVLERRQPSPVGPLTPALVAEQQKVADAFAQLGLIPKPIRVADIVWLPGQALASAR